MLSVMERVKSPFLLAMLSGLVREYQQRDQYLDTGLDRIYNINVRAASSKYNTRLTRVSPKYFVSILDKFLNDFHQIMQTVFAQTQRVTAQSL